MAFDSFFKQLMQDFLSKYEIHPDEPVGKLPLKVDLVVKYLQKPAISLIPLLETHFASINLFEYKSSHDIPKKHDLSKLIGYLGLYCDQHAIGVDQIQVAFSLWYVSVKRPNFFKKLLESKKLITTTTRGLYRLNLPFLCSYYLMIINELDIIAENLPLLLLSSGETLKNAIRLIAQQKLVLDSKLEKYLCLMYYINYEEVHQMTEMQSILPESIQKNIKLAIKDIGLKEVIDIIGLEEVIKAVGLENVIKAVGLENVIKAVGPEQVEKTLRKLKAQTK